MSAPPRSATVFILLLILPALPALAEDYSSAAIAKRYPNTALTAERAADARMQGECLVGLKEMNFRRASEFDPVAEWTNYRSLSLLNQYPPCEVLVMMEVARARLKGLMSVTAP